MVDGETQRFRGLFFFPFIVAAGLSLVLSKFDLSQQRIGQIAFGVVAVWFVLLKTSPSVNMLTAQFASVFIGAPAQIILDPTDLLALVVLLPGWKLWIHNQNRCFGRKQASFGCRCHCEPCIQWLHCLPSKMNITSLLKMVT